MNTTREQLRRYQVRPKQSLGQNFLLDEAIRDQIVETAELVPEDSVLEIGPGLGTLTSSLAARARKVVAVELDDRLTEILQHRFAQESRVSVIHGNILDLDPVDLIGPIDHSYKVIANLPYYITSAVLRHVLEARKRPQLAVFMVQEEVAERICAAPGRLSILAVSVQLYAQPRIVQRVPAEAFYPRPKVGSALLRLDVFSEPVVKDVPVRRFFQVVRAGFSQKRKQLANSLSGGLALSKKTTRAALVSAGVDPRRRPETVDLQEWRDICLALASVEPAG
jgi:16S rRNA (adenine1518-N6/adenine1519-N6)-dimethyltransferase